jgi:hypothetical protein
MKSKQWQQIQQFFCDKYGASHGELLSRRTMEIYANLCSLCDGESKARRQTMCEKILPRIAMYQALQDEVADADAYAAVWEYTKDLICAPQRRQYARLEHLPRFFSLFRAMFLHIIQTSDRWETSVTCAERTRFSFEIHRCLWQETCEKCGCSALCRVFCDSDYENFGGMKRTAFSRTQTLGTGGTLCDFTFSDKK